MSIEKKIKQLAPQIAQFFTPKNPEEKTGNGHNIEHIEGVLRRTNDIVTTMEMDPQKFNINISRDLAVMSAALHDIGNAIERKGHNHYGLGIIYGQLTMDQILDVPMKYFNSATNKNILANEPLMTAAKEYVSIHGCDLSEINSIPSENLREILLNAAKTVMTFDITYFGIEADKFLSYVDQKYHIPEEYKMEINSYFLGTEKDTYLDNIKPYNPKLKELTKLIQEIYPQGSASLKTVAEAVQDHNVDFKINAFDDKERYLARSTYGSIVADADKDCCLSSAIMRAYLFNKTMEKLNEADITPKKKQQIYMSVMDQANQRYRKSAAEYGKIVPIFNEIIFSKGDLEKNKSVIILSDENIKQYKEEEIFVFIDPKSKEEVKFTITKEEGDDKFSQLDKIFESDIMKKYWEPFIKQMEDLGDPHNTQKSIEKINDVITNIFDSAKTIEDAFFIGESKDYEANFGKKLTKKSFTDLVKQIIPEGYISVEEQLQEVMDVFVMFNPNTDQKELQRLQEYYMSALQNPNFYLTTDALAKNNGLNPSNLYFDENGSVRDKTTNLVVANRTDEGFYVGNIGHIDIVVTIQEEMELQIELNQTEELKPEEIDSSDIEEFEV